MKESKFVYSFYIYITAVTLVSFKILLIIDHKVD